MEIVDAVEIALHDFDAVDVDSVLLGDGVRRIFCRHLGGRVRFLRAGGWNRGNEEAPVTPADERVAREANERPIFWPQVFASAR